MERLVKRLNNQSKIMIDDICEEVKLRLAYFDSITCKVVEYIEGSLDEIACRLAGIEREHKHGLPLISGCRYGGLRTKKGSLRHRGNAEAVTAIVAEHDAGAMQIEEARRRLAESGVAALLYASPSSTAGEPRWRVLAPLAAEHPISAHGGLVDRLNAALNGALAQESWTEVQGWFFGTVKGQPKEILIVDGVPLDQIADDGAISAPVTAPTEPPPGETATATPSVDLRAHDVEALEQLVRQVQEQNDDYGAFIRNGQAFKGADLPFDCFVDYAQKHVTCDDCIEYLNEKWQSFDPTHVGERDVLEMLDEHGVDTGSYREEIARDAFEADQRPEGVREEPAPPERKSRISKIGPLDHAAAEPELVRSWFGCGEYLRLSGEAGSGKTTLVADLSVRIAAGLSWRGCDVLPGSVLWIEAEGARNLRTRIEAKCAELNLKLDDLPLYMFAEPISLFLEREWQPLLDEIVAEVPAPIRLIVLDTQARVTAGGDENSAADAAVVIRAVQAIIARTGAAVMFLHHLPHGADRARGSSAYLGAVDCELIARRDDTGLGTLKCVKMRNREEPKPIHYRLASVPIGFGPDGGLVTGASAIEAQKASRAGVAIRGHAANALAILRSGEDAISVEAWCAEFMGGYAGVASPESKRRAFNRAVEGLKEQGVVSVANGLASLRVPTDWHQSIVGGVQ